MSSDTYEILAIRYGHHDRWTADNFIGGDSHDEATLPSTQGPPAG